MPTRPRRVVSRALRALRRRRRPRPNAAGAAPPAATAAPQPNAREELVRSLERGRPVDAAIIAQVRALAADGQPDAARAIAEGLRREAKTESLGSLASGIVAFREGYMQLARDELRRVPRAARLNHAAAQYVRAGYTVDPIATGDEIRALVAEDPPEIAARTWFQILMPVFGFGDQELARDIFAIVERRVAEDPKRWRAGARQVEWLRPWIEADSDSPTAPPPPGGRRTFAIVDYGHPGAGRASANIGDHIQTIAALGHLVRHQNLRLHGPSELVTLLEDLGQRTRPELQDTAIDADLEVMTVHRDASMYEAIPEQTWVLCFGWYMHALFKMRHGFPLHRNLRPIFVSFHCNKRDLLTPAAVEYLKRYGPVGCRDWTTVYLLASIGVPAFFSGCVTTTIDAVFPDLDAEPAAGAPVGYVDAAPRDVPPGAVTYRHSDGAVRRRSFVANVREALKLLETYRRKHRRIVTSRLHCYLPARSIGVDVAFRPSNRADVRFDGLIDIDDQTFDAIRSGLRAKLDQVLTAILTGHPEDEVYALWREITADDVAAAEARRRRERPAVAGPDIDEQLTQVRSATTMTERTAEAPDGDPIHCALIVRPGMGRPEQEPAVLVASLLEHASRPLHLWVVGTRGGARPIEQRLARRFPQVTFGWVPTAALGPAERTRLLLPDLLPDVDRVVLLPVPAVADANVAELAELDLGSHAIAAARRLERDASGFAVIHAAAARLHNRPDLAAELRRTAHAHHAFDFDAFATDVLVLDLERLRRERFRDRALAAATEFGLDETEALHFLVGPNRAELPGRWAAAPTRTPGREPGLMYWPDAVMPWDPSLAPERDRWRAYAARYRRGSAQRVTAP